MSTGPRLVLKQSTGWFAAGWAFAEATTTLSDAGFKLFAWLCMNADRYTGCIRITMVEIAQALRKRRRDRNCARRTRRAWSLPPRHGLGVGDSG